MRDYRNTNNINNCGCGCGGNCDDNLKVNGIWETIDSTIANLSCTAQCFLSFANDPTRRQQCLAACNAAENPQTMQPGFTSGGINTNTILLFGAGAFILYKLIK